MLTLIPRSKSFVSGYRDYCREFYDHDITTFKPTNPAKIDDGWFDRTAPWYARKEREAFDGYPRGYHYWAVDGERFIGEFQLRTELTEEVMTWYGSVGYSVRVSEWGKGYGKKILRQGFDIARGFGLQKLLLTIADSNAASIHICEAAGGVLMDKIKADRPLENVYILRRYWIYL